MARDEVGGQAVELGRALRGDRPQIRPDVAVEVLADDDELVAQLLDARAGRVVFVDAGEAEVAQRALDVVLRFRVGPADVERVSASYTPRFSDSSVPNALIFCDTCSAACRTFSSGWTAWISPACDPTASSSSRTSS